MKEKNISNALNRSILAKEERLKKKKKKEKTNENLKRMNVDKKNLLSVKSQ